MTARIQTALETESLRRFYDKASSGYDLWMQLFDRAMLKDSRQRVCSRAHGKTLELAVGTGRNLAFYPRDVRLTGIDVSPAMLTIARQRAQVTGLNVELRLGDAQALDFPDNSFDTVVATLLLSSVPDGDLATAEAWRVLRPKGRLLVLDIARSPSTPVRFMQRLIDPIAVRFTGDHALREPLDFLGPAGFNIADCDRHHWGTIEEVTACKG